MEPWEEEDVLEFDQIIQASRGKQHDGRLLSACPCKGCALRRFAGRKSKGQSQASGSARVDNPLAADDDDDE